MKTIALEIRDRGTFIPALAVKMVPTIGETDMNKDAYERERYLLRRAGFNFDNTSVILCRMEASGVDRNATYDPWAWGNSARTMSVAHQYIEQNFDHLSSGDVIDVEYVLRETKEAKRSERLTHPNTDQ